MATAGLIYGAIAVAWLAYLIPLLLRRHRADEGVEAIEPLSPVGRRPIVGEVADGGGVSTPLMRRAGLRELRLVEARATRRRRNVLAVLMFLLSVVLVLAVAGVLPWWALAVPGGFVVVFFGGSRVSVALLRRELGRRREALLGADDEATVAVRAEELGSVTGVALGVPDDQGGQLWDPLPITTPAYVAKPVAGRSVRTISFGDERARAVGE